jgi:hypothetical protein
LAGFEGLRNNSIIAEANKKLDSYQLSLLPNVESIKHQLRRISKREKIYTYSQNYDIPTELLNTYSGSNFVVFDSVMEDDDRFIMRMDESIHNFVST